MARTVELPPLQGIYSQAGSEAKGLCPGHHMYHKNHSLGDGHHSPSILESERLASLLFLVAITPTMAWTVVSLTAI